MGPLQANALQEKTDSDAKQELKLDDEEDDEEYDPENEHFDDDEDAQDNSAAYKALASQVSVSTSNISSGQEKVTFFYEGLLRMPPVE